MARGQEAEDSVYDFLYVDARRVAVFLSQFGPQYGYLTGYTRGVSETDSTKGTVNVAIVKGDITSNTQTTQTRQFDPQWLAPLSFLDYANQRGMIVRDLTQARIGQIVLATGRFALFDLGIMQKVWGIDAIRDVLVQQAVTETLQGAAQPEQRMNRNERQRLERERRATVTREMSGNLEMIKLLPHAIQASIITGETEVWCSLREENMVVPASELMIKHGLIVAGDWNIVGIWMPFQMIQSSV